MSEHHTQKTVTVLFTDVEGSTALRTSRGDAAAHELLMAQEEVVRREIASTGGREIKSTGDGVMVAFASARNAIACALGIQGALANGPVRVRIGLNAGEALEQDGDLYGEAVNAAARVMAKAKGGEILVSEVVRQLAGTMPDVAFSDRGRVALKGFSGRWRLYAVERPLQIAPAAGSTRSPVFGRTNEIGVVSAALHKAARGVGRAIIVEGEAGIGKSRLLGSALGLARDLHFQVFVGGAHEFERDRPFGALVDALGLRSSSDDRARQEIARLVDLTGSEDTRFPVVERITDLVEQFALQRPLVLAVEDLHWADPSTVLAVHRLAEGVEHLPVALICTLRPAPRIPELAGVLRVLEAAGAEKLTLEPLDEAAVTELATDALGAHPGPRLLAQLEGAAGNPLFVSELITALGQEGLIEKAGDVADVGDVSMPPSLRLTIIRRLAFLSEPSLEALRIASVLGASFSLEDLSVVMGRTALDLLPALDEAKAAGLLGESGEELVFRHELVRDAVYEDMLQPVRRALHTQAARSLARSGAPAAQIASHVALGAAVGDAEGVEWLHKAAKEAMNRSPGAAIELLEKALELVGADHDERNALQVSLARALNGAQRPRDANRIARDLLSRPLPRAVRNDARQELYMALGAEGRYVEAVAEIDRAAEETPLSAVEEARLAAAKANALHSDARDRAVVEAERAIALGERAGDPYSVFVGTQTLAFCKAFVGYIDEAIRLTDRAFDVAGAAVALDGRVRNERVNRRMFLVWGDRFDEAEREIDATLADAEDASVATATNYHYNKAHLELWSGRWDEAIAVAEAGLAVAEPAGLVTERDHLHQILAFVAIQRDELKTAEQEAMHIPTAKWIPALLAEARGDRRAMGAILGAYRSAAVDNPTSWNMALALWTLPDWVRLYLDAGDRSSALVLVEVLEEAGRRMNTPTARGAGLRSRGLYENDPGLLLRAVDVYRTGPRVFDRAQACEWAASAIGTDDTARSLKLVEEALGIYDSLGAQRASARSEALLRKLGVRRGRRGPRPRASVGWESLTQTERRVTALVADGLTYREIGERLFISRRTVETHVAHVFAKLGLAARQDLAQAAREHGLSADTVTQQA